MCVQVSAFLGERVVSEPKETRSTEPCCCLTCTKEDAMRAPACTPLAISHTGVVRPVGSVMRFAQAHS